MKLWHQLMVPVALLVIALIACWIWVPREPERRDERASRFNQHCLLVQIEMQDGLRAALPGSHRNEKISRFFFDRHAATEWREVRFCAPEGADVEDACDRGDAACEAAQFERAIAWTTWFQIAPRTEVPTPKP